MGFENEFASYEPLRRILSSPKVQSLQNRLRVRRREEQENGHDTITSIGIVGGASGLALFGSALSDIGGFLVITQSSMGFFSTFGLFCAIMIGLSLVASMILAPSLIGIVYNEKA